MAFEDTNEEMNVERMNELLALTGAPFRLRADDDQDDENLEADTETEDFSIVGELTTEQMEVLSKLMDVPFCHHCESTCSEEFSNPPLK